MNLISELSQRYQDHTGPFIVADEGELSFEDVIEAKAPELDGVLPGDVVALIGDFEPDTIKTLLHLIDRRVIFVPLTRETRPDHEYFFDAAGIDVVIESGNVRRIRKKRLEHPFLSKLRDNRHPGLVLFSSGTTGRAKAILFNFKTFLARFRNPRPTLRTINFLLFDHIGGINTLFHTLFNQGVVVIPKERTPEKILEEIRKNGVELLPTTPTFLRMMLISGLLEKNTSGSLKVVTYGTERMDQGTLDKLCDLMPAVDFRQTYGMSELGILRAKSRERDSLWMKIGGEGIETRIDEGVLLIRSSNRMIGYLNADSPFDEQGWYDTKDLVDQDDEWVRIVGRTVDVISVGGIKVLPEEIERAALLHPDVAQAKAVGVENPITGQHIELVCEACNEADLTRKGMRSFLKNHLSSLVMPHRIRIGDVAISHRFKKH